MCNCADATRWNALLVAVAQNQQRAALGGGAILAMMPGNEHDQPWASIQALDHENPRGAVWIAEAFDLNAAADIMISSGIAGEDRG